ncbi:hypothetical protein PAMP_010021 [Pampus punctatissimus]
MLWDCRSQGEEAGTGQRGACSHHLQAAVQGHLASARQPHIDSLICSVVVQSMTTETPQETDCFLKAEEMKNGAL